jgi:hypothetical protein
MNMYIIDFINLQWQHCSQITTRPKNSYFDLYYIMTDYLYKKYCYYKENININEFNIYYDVVNKMYIENTESEDITEKMSICNI